MRHFIDRSGTLSNVRRTAVGGMLVDATLAKVGVMGYAHRDGNQLSTVRRHNPAETLASSAAAVATAPVTHGHPSQFVDIHNYDKLSKGHVVGQPEFVDGHIKATLAINDAALIRAIELGQCREVSMGYMAEHDGIAGVTESGEAFDESRVSISWNHIAIVPAGRAGKTVRLMLDSAEIPQEEPEIMLNINGQEIAADAAQAAFDSYDASLQAQLVDLNGQVAALSAAKDELQAALAVAGSAETLTAAVDAELARREAAVLAKQRLETIKAAYPTLNLDGRSEAFIDGLEAAIAARPVLSKDPENLEAVTKPALVLDASPAKPKPESADDVYRRMREEERARSRAPSSAIASPGV